MSARSEMLQRIRAANQAASAVLDPVYRSYQRDGRNAGSSEVLAVFRERLVDYGARVIDAPKTAIAAAVTQALAEAAPALAAPGLPVGWTDVPIDDPTRPARELDVCSAVVTGCAAACAETGTIVLDGGSGQGRRALTLLPDRHVCVVLAEQVVDTVPELLGRLDPVRPITFISGPSATSDIELIRVEGVHGPRHLTVVLVA